MVTLIQQIRLETMEERIRQLRSLLDFYRLGGPRAPEKYSALFGDTDRDSNGIAPESAVNTALDSILHEWRVRELRNWRHLPMLPSSPEEAPPPDPSGVAPENQCAAQVRLAVPR